LSEGGEPEAAVDEQAGGASPDVYLDVPVLNVDEIELDVDDLRARVSLQAEVLDLLKLNVGADVALGHVHLGIKGVEAQAQLKVRLGNVAKIIERVLTTVDRNPRILEELARGAGGAIRDVGTGAKHAVGELGEGTGSAVREVGRGAGSAVEDVGEGARSGVEDVARGAGSAVDGVGRGAGRAVEDVGEGAGSAAGNVGESAGEAAGNVASVADEAVGIAGREPHEAVKGAGRAVAGAGKEPSGDAGEVDRGVASADRPARRPARREEGESEERRLRRRSRSQTRHARESIDDDGRRSRARRTARGTGQREHPS
jgi:hypothetical protein